MDDTKKSGPVEALKRDWEQTKHDFKKDAGQELHQEIGDTLKQATGNERIPPPGVPNAKLDDKKFDEKLGRDLNRPFDEKLRK